jgi:colicin import membrane protein
MKKLFLMCFLFAFIANISAQEKSADQVKKTKTTAEKTVKQKAPLKKDGTPDKRFKSKENNTPAEGKAKAAAQKTEAKTKKEVKERVSNEKAPKKIKDKVTGTYKGKKVYTGPRGGKYYINSNGNKTYISED